MSEPLQSGYHPDADQISAFVEHALPAHDREQMLDHLAACEECRAVVAMSLPEIEEPEPVRLPQSAPHKSWWSGWTLAWSLTGALAAIVLSVIFIRHAIISPNTPAANQTAGIQPVEPRIPQGQPPAASQSVPSRGSPEKTASDRPANSSENAKIELQRNADAAAKSYRFSAVPTEGRDVAPLDQKAEAPSAVFGKGVASGLRAGSQSGPEARAQNPSPLSPAVAANSPAPAPAPPVEPSTAREGQIIDDVQITSAAPTEPATVGTTGANIQLDEVQQAQLIRVRNPLPSRLPVLSMATSGPRMIAIDTQNAVFLSSDAGKHWKPIQTQWQGRAVKASLVEFPSANKNFARLQAVGPGAVVGRAAAPAKAADALTLRDQPTATCCSLKGTVTDRTGAVIPNASVSTTDLASHAERTVRTDSTGRYLIDGLAPGTYKLEAVAPGFMKQDLPAVSVATSQPNVADLSLNVGAATQTVTVQTESNDISAERMPAAKLKASQPVTGIFEIVTDNGDHWTSADGITWRQK